MYVYSHTPACFGGIFYCDKILLSSNPGHSFGANNWFDFGSPHEDPHLKREQGIVLTPTEMFRSAFWFLNLNHWLLIFMPEDVRESEHAALRC